MKNILFYALTQHRGGIESFIKNYKPYFQNIHLDFVKITPNKLPYEDELYSSDIYYVPTRKDGFFSRKEIMRDILTQKKYDCLWFNANDLVDTEIIDVAKKEGIKCIGHAHNSKADKPRRTLQHYMNRRIASKKFDGKFACSKLAAKWFYTNSKESVLVYNAVDVNKFIFDKVKREKVRKKYKIPDDSLVIGNVARLEKAKNWFYLVDIFGRYHKYHPMSYLMIVGNGSLKRKLKEYIIKKELSEFVVFTGEVDDVQSYLSSFDMYLMPSLNEGLPVSLVEAQASGLECLAADNITREVDIIGKINYLPISKDRIDEWVANIKFSVDRDKYGRQLFNTRFDINISSKILEKEILRIINGK